MHLSENHIEMELLAHCLDFDIGKPLISTALDLPLQSNFLFDGNMAPCNNDTVNYPDTNVDATIRTAVFDVEVIMPN